MGLYRRIPFRDNPGSVYGVVGSLIPALTFPVGFSFKFYWVLVRRLAPAAYPRIRIRIEWEISKARIKSDMYIGDGLLSALVSN